MKISFQEDDSQVLFVISDVSSEYRSAFESSFYSLENGSYVKGFPKDTKNMDRIKSNFEKYADDMFGQMVNLKKVMWEDALLGFISKVEGTDIDWWLTGSCATCLRGVAIQPHDVDIMLNSRDMDKINDIFADHIVEPIRSSNGWVVKNFGVMFMEARIDLAFDPEGFVDDPEPVDFGPYAMEHLEPITWRDHVIKAPPLELQLQVNRRRGRKDRVQAIESFLHKNEAQDSKVVEEYLIRKPVRT